MHSEDYYKAERKAKHFGNTLVRCDDVAYFCYQPGNIEEIATLEPRRGWTTTRLEGATHTFKQMHRWLVNHPPEKAILARKAKDVKATEKMNRARKHNNMEWTDESVTLLQEEMETRKVLRMSNNGDYVGLNCPICGAAQDEYWTNINTYSCLHYLGTSDTRDRREIETQFSAATHALIIGFRHYPKSPPFTSFYVQMFARGVYEFAVGDNGGKYKVKILPK